MALGGVATGSMKAKEHATAAAIIRYSGFSPAEIDCWLEQKHQRSTVQLYSTFQCILAWIFLYIFCKNTVPVPAILASAALLLLCCSWPLWRQRPTGWSPDTWGTDCSGQRTPGCPQTTLISQNSERARVHYCSHQQNDWKKRYSSEEQQHVTYVSFHLVKIVSFYSAIFVQQNTIKVFASVLNAKVLRLQQSYLYWLTNCCLFSHFRMFHSNGNVIIYLSCRVTLFIVLPLLQRNGFKLESST